MAEVKGSYVGGTPVYFKDEKARAMLSNEYVPAENYAAGNLCIHEGKLYKATKATTGTWDATAWTETNLAEVNAGMQKSITDLTEKRKWTKVSFVGAVDVTLSIPSNKCAKVPITAEEICVEITVKRNVSTTIKFSQYLKTPGDYIGGYYNSEKYYGSYQLGYNNNIIYLNKSWLRVVDNGVEYNNADTVQVDVYYR